MFPPRPQLRSCWRGIMLKKRTFRPKAGRSLPRRDETNITKRFPPFSYSYQNFRVLNTKDYLSYWKDLLTGVLNLRPVNKFPLLRKIRAKSRALTLSLVILFLITNSASLETSVLANLPKESSNTASPTFAQIKAAQAPIFSWPLKGAVSQKFSFYHRGIDIPNPYGTEIKSVASGSIEKAGFETGFGKTVIVIHQGGFKSRYAHLSKINVKEGDQIAGGVDLGEVGNSGWANGSHLHLEIYSNETAINPLNILP